MQVSRTAELSDATMAFTCTKDLWAHGYAEAFQELQNRVSLVRGWGDGYGHFMVAAGKVDIMLDPILNSWDVAALKPCIEGAGGRFTDTSGEVRELGQSALSTNGVLHDQVLDILKA